MIQFMLISQSGAAWPQRSCAHALVHRSLHEMRFWRAASYMRNRHELTRAIADTSQFASAAFFVRHQLQA